ncbi:MAG: hypothetical protein KatS3mg115_1332 [Candidatus Poribacteria bacterium]|nr:MAG: hypothetical protein KatS3mg115_1332 [Candidatus Poribacteria bacterium]
MRPTCWSTTFAPYMEEMGLSTKELLALGQVRPGEGGFGSTIFALRTSTYANGVSELHGHVSRGLWQSAYGEVPEEEVPIRHITNGVHVSTWVAVEMAELYDSYLGLRWREEPHRPEAWERIDNIPASELWKAHERAREHLVQRHPSPPRPTKLHRAHADPAELQAASEVLDTEALTIGFARRAAPYKRLLLLLTDPDRLTRILTDPDRPVQLIVAGKAHPADDAGKQLIQRLVQFARQEPLRKRIVFLENYDIYLAQLLVAGCDVWLNTPRRPNEASGTSGMKAALNGVLNLSVLDGWWDEAYREARRAGIPIGWAIGDGRQTDSLPEPEADRLDANALYALLEREVVPMFYQRGPDGVPRAWVERMKHSIRFLAPQFNTHRMVDRLPGAGVPPCCSAPGPIGRKRLAARPRTGRLAGARPRRLGARRHPAGGGPSRRGSRCWNPPFPARVVVDLAGLSPEEVTVQIAVGRMSPTEVAAPLEEVTYTTLKFDPAQSQEGRAVFVGEFTSTFSGHVGVTARIFPVHPDLDDPMALGMVHWA